MANQTTLGMNTILIMPHLNEQALAFSSTRVLHKLALFISIISVIVMHPLPVIAVGELPIVYSVPETGLSRCHTLGCIRVTRNFRKKKPR